jgi:DNA-binding PucR family transcriptional regulator
VDEPTTLQALLDNLGRDVVQVVVAPRGLEVPVGEPVIYDAEERSSIARDAIVLAVGARPGTAPADRLLEAAAQAGATAVVFKSSTDLGGLVRGAHDVAVLSVPEEMTWTQLHALLNLSRFSAARDASGIAGVPLGDLFALANAVAGVVGGAVTIEDPARRVLAYSTLGQPIDAARRGSILGRQVPDSPGMRTLYRQVIATQGVMTATRAELNELLHNAPVDVDDLKPRSAVAVRAGSQAIGTIWVVHENDELDDESEHALAEAARIAAPHVIQARAARDVERRLRAELVLAVLEGQGSIEEAAARLGFTAGSPLSIAAFQSADREGIDELQRERLVDLVVVLCESMTHRTCAVAIGDTVYAVLQGDRPLERKALLQLAEQVQARSESRLGTPLLASVATTVDAVRDFVRARRDVERVLGVLRAGAGTVATTEDLRSKVVLAELKELSADHPGLTRGKLQRVLEHDAEHNAAYVETLRAYLDCFGDVPRAAERISVHPNTFRYRMRRLLELFELDLDDPDERVVIELQLRLQDDESKVAKPAGKSRRAS